MTTDITELAQSLKAAAGKATRGNGWHSPIQPPALSLCTHQMTIVAETSSSGLTSTISARQRQMQSLSLWLTLPTSSRW